VSSSGERQALILVATYNEHRNLSHLVERILALPIAADILIVDDNSPDGTGALADTLADRGCLTVLHRRQKSGLAAALLAGFSEGMKEKYQWIVNLDGDLSHDPAAIPDLLAAATKNDLVIGSRYVKGGHVVNWPISRLCLSRLASSYVRASTGMPVHDPTSGFRCFGRRALEVALTYPILSRGYSFHIETLYRVWSNGLRVTEVPIRFTNRCRGCTKLSYRIIAEAVFVTLGLKRNGDWWVRRKTGPRGEEA
jgi:dolichol-phosphate mannosyltransferase